MSQYQLVQLNIAKMKEPLESPSMADFVANLDRINTLAEQSAGFVWRLKDDSGSAAALRPFGDDIVDTRERCALAPRRPTARGVDEDDLPTSARSRPRSVRVRSDG